MILPPPDFVLSTTLRKAASDGGFRIGPLPVDGWPGWLAFESPMVEGRIFLAGETMRGPYFIGLSRADLARTLAWPAWAGEGPGVSRTEVATLERLHAMISDAWKAARALPAPDPLADFAAATAAMPRSTEAERLHVQRIGQDIFRNRLMIAGGGRCPLTGIEDPALLRASHITPWAECASDAERLDPENGLLLSALWDAAFDRGLVSFDDEGAPLYSSSLTDPARKALKTNGRIALTDGQRQRLARHRHRLAK